MTAPPLAGDRAHLRPLTDADLDAVVAYATTPGFFRFITVPDRLRSHYAPDDARAFLEDARESWRAGWPTWAIEHGGRLVGTIRIHKVPWHPAGAVGYGLHPDARGRGLATDALRTVLSWCRDEGRPLPAAHCEDANVASQRVLAACGYRRVEGRRWEVERVAGCDR